MTRKKGPRGSDRRPALNAEQADLRSRWHLLQLMLETYEEKKGGRPSPEDLAKAFADFFRLTDAPTPPAALVSFLCSVLEKSVRKSDVSIDRFCREGNAVNTASILQKGGTPRSPVSKHTYEEATLQSANEYGIGVKKLEKLRTVRARERSPERQPKNPTQT